MLRLQRSALITVRESLLFPAMSKEAEEKSLDDAVPKTRAEDAEGIIGEKSNCRFGVHYEGLGLLLRAQR